MATRRAIGIVALGVVALTTTAWGELRPGATGGNAGQMTLEAMKKEFQRPQAIPFPADNAYTREREHLGKVLFFDPRLSGSNAISCASCHNPAFSWGDGLPKGVGHGSQVLGRRTPTVLNLAWTDLLFWDGRAEGLEAQALGPIQSPAEMNQDLPGLVKKLQGISGYSTLFAMAYPGEGITPETIAKAIATFERTVVSGPAPFDAWIAGNEGAISEAAKRGFMVFNTKGKCVACHKGWNFSDAGFHDIGLDSPDEGRGKLLPLVKMQHAFKTPTLRNVEGRGPYMHNGSLATLADVVDYYNKGGLSRPSRAENVQPLRLTEGERRDLVEFMKTLTSHDLPVQIPVLPR
jgi:cytochrome c peroxidase